MAERWQQLTRTQQRLVLAGVALETTLKIAMLVDLRRRPAQRIHGKKWLWASSTLVNSAGVIPIVYFVAGRKR
jgi:methylase of polypeptide subunit release factors